MSRSMFGLVLAVIVACFAIAATLTLGVWAIWIGPPLVKIVAALGLSGLAACAIGVTLDELLDRTPPAPPTADGERPHLEGIRNKGHQP